MNRVKKSKQQPAAQRTNERLVVRNFAQIAEVDLALGDLTLLVGAQGTGKSLTLQWLKAAIDGKQIMTALRAAGQQATEPAAVVELVFGDGMGQAWRSRSEVTFRGRPVSPSSLFRVGSGTESVFYIPAHRAMLISDGWASPFQRLSPETPVVARLFSQNLFDRFSARGGDQLFPQDRLLKREYRDLIDAAVFHGGRVAFVQEQQHTKRLRLIHGEAALPFMTWTAGQREFTPLMLGLYHLLTRTKVRKRQEVDWVIIEEPEMGLHPQAITVFLLLVLDLLWRGYRVVVSTHSPHILTALWMLQRLKELDAPWQSVRDGFGVDGNALKEVAETALTKTYKTYALEFGRDNKVRSKDISGLDPDSDDPKEADWGGLTGYSSRFGDAVRRALIASER